jgi:hypothetical protein
MKNKTITQFHVKSRRYTLAGSLENSVLVDEEYMKNHKPVSGIE